MLEALLASVAIAAAPSGVLQVRAKYPLDETVERLEALVTARGMVVFARIDFSRDATHAGLSMQPEQLLIVGSPRRGTPLLKAAPTAGLDLPLKVLIWTDPAGVTWIAYNETDYIMRRHGIPPELAENIAGLAALITEVAN
ncbi:MAG TPA: DUF302 domain-containing protein [Rhodanobacteraceae bacterium]